MVLSWDGKPLTHWDRQSEAEIKADMTARGLPFEPMQKHISVEHPEGNYSAWLFKCPLLDADGRCGDYENRPELCRKYEPRTDMLCVHFNAEGGDPTIGLGYQMASAGNDE